MRKKLLSMLAVALGAAAAVVGVMAISAGAQHTSAKGWSRVIAPGTSTHAALRSSSRRGHRLVLYTKTVRSAYVDVGDAGESSGDSFIFEENVFANRGLTHRVGRDSVQCTFRVTTFSCNGTLQLRHGKIVVDGALFSENDNRLAVTGGTGRYSAVRGSLNAISTSDTNSTLVFRLR